MGGEGLNLQTLITSMNSATVTGNSITFSLPNLTTGAPAGAGNSITFTIPTEVPQVRTSTGDVFTTIPRSLPPLNGGSRVVISSPFGNVIATLPRGTSLADLQALLSSFKAAQSASPEILTGGMTEAPASASVLTMGSHTVFEAPHAQAQTFAGLPANANAPASTFGHMPVAAMFSAAEVVFAANQAPAHQGQASGSAAPTAGAAVKIPLSESVRIPDVAREILTGLGLLPPGIGATEALPRLQEVLRLWTSGSLQGGELPAHVAQIVDNALKSAVLATALTAGPLTASPLKDGQSPELQKGSFGGFGSALFSEPGRGTTAGPLTKNQIAEAVLNALAGTFPGSPSAAPTLRSPASIPGEAPAANLQNASSAPGASKAPSGDKQTGRSDVVRAESGIVARSETADRAASKIRLNGDETHERHDTLAQDLETQRAPHDQESQGNAEEQDAHAVEALWSQLSSDLQRAGFVSASGSLRPLEISEEGREVLGLVAARLPEGWDVIDGLALIDARMGLSPEAGAVNNALYRLASYRRTWKGDKVRAVLEPLHDAFVALELVAEDVIPGTESDISLEDLKGFQTQAAAAQMILDRPRWMARLGDEEDREEIARVLPDVEGLLERVADKLPVSHRPAYFKAPEGVALLN
ncbi:MAG TPA: hypothetical protein VFX30_00915 [bacterium]|nr:hypothetical protein [bacterium]